MAREAVRRWLGAVVIFPFFLAGCGFGEIYRPHDERDELAEAEGLCLAMLSISPNSGNRDRDLAVYLVCVDLPASIRARYRQ